MTIAQVFQKSQENGIPYIEIVERADEVAVEADQDWDLQQTTFKFVDGSQLRATAPSSIKVI